MRNIATGECPLQTELVVVHAICGLQKQIKIKPEFPADQGHGIVYTAQPFERYTNRMNRKPIAANLIGFQLHPPQQVLKGLHFKLRQICAADQTDFHNVRSHRVCIIAARTTNANPRNARTAFRNMHH